MRPRPDKGTWPRDGTSIQALYVIIKRANALTPGLTVEIDRTHAIVEADALEQLRACSVSHHLPAHIDPFQPNYRLSIRTAGDDFIATGTAAALVQRQPGAPPRLAASRLPSRAWCWSARDLESVLRALQASPGSTS